jgi:hypothetical protein
MKLRYAATAPEFEGINQIMIRVPADVQNGAPNRRAKFPLQVSCVHKNQRPLSKRQVNQRRAHTQGQTYAHVMNQ